jgi:hypothetical protein
MTFGECRDLSLNLIHQETIAGTEIPGAYNNQQDYLAKIPGLINAAQMDIATTTKPIPSEIYLGELYREESNGNYIYTLPEDLWQRRGSGLIVPIPYHSRYQGLRHGRYNRMRMIGNQKLILVEWLPDDTVLEYYRYPYDLPVQPDENQALDNVREAQAIVPYYVAAHVVMYDDAFLYATLQNEYTAKKEALRELPHTEIDTVEDVYMDPSFDYHVWW